MLLHENDAAGEPTLSHNLLGQRFGRKGLETRARIVGAARKLIEERNEAPLTLSSVAREACVGTPSVYHYFADLGELVMAALREVMDTADAAFLDRLRLRWPDDGLENCARDFVEAHLAFWQRHTRILHLRNTQADANDQRFVDYRNEVSYPLIEMLVRQMDGDPAEAVSRHIPVATVLLTAFERMATVMTTPNFPGYKHPPGVPSDVVRRANLVKAEAGIITLTIQHQRRLAV